MLTIVKKNDSHDVITYQLENDDNSNVDLTGATVNFVMGKKNKLITNSPAVITSATSGIVTYQLTSSDTLISGTFLAEFVVTFPNGTQKTFPSSGYITIDIEQNLDTSQNNVVVDMIAAKQGDFEAKLDSILRQGIGAELTAMNEYTWTTTNGQTTFTFPSSANYTNSAKWFQVTVGNVPVSNSLVIRTSTTSFSLNIDPSTIKAGMEVRALWTEPMVPITSGHHATHELNGQDEINIANLRNYQELVVTPLTTKANEHQVDVSRFGYDLNAVKSAVATLKDGDTLYFPNALTTYQLLGGTVTISVPNVTVKGSGKIYMDYGFRSTEGGFVMDGLRLECPTYSSNAYGFRVDQPPTGKVVQDFRISNCTFTNFFYACYFQGGVYGAADPSFISIRDVIIENCKSFTYTDKNAGHFQCLQTENVSYINNRTYGGVNATSYNAIQTNGHVKIIGNYDDNNAYGSCEVENQGTKTVIANNTFRKQIWVDDSSDVIIADNNVEDDIFISVEKYGVNNIQVVGNICARVKLDSFGSNYVAGMIINNVSIRNNKFINGANKAHGVFVNGTYCGKVIVQDNDFPATYSTAKISASRASTLDIVVINNDVNGSVLVSGTGGKLTSNGNLGASYTSTAPDEGDSTGALPTASLAYRGKITVLRGAAGVADLLYVCKKLADGSYSWVQIG